MARKRYAKKAAQGAQERQREGLPPLFQMYYFVNDRPKQLLGYMIRAWSADDARKKLTQLCCNDEITITHAEGAED